MSEMDDLLTEIIDGKSWNDCVGKHLFPHDVTMQNLTMLLIREVVKLREAVEKTTPVSS